MSDIQQDEATEFGDCDPEDEWDDTDPFGTRLEILERIVNSVQERRKDRFKLRVHMAADLVQKMVHEHAEEQRRHRRRALDPDGHRLLDLVEIIETLEDDLDED